MVSNEDVQGGILCARWYSTQKPMQKKSTREKAVEGNAALRKKCSENSKVPIRNRTRGSIKLSSTWRLEHLQMFRKRIFRIIPPFHADIELVDWFSYPPVEIV